MQSADCGETNEFTWWNLLLPRTDENILSNLLRSVFQSIISLSRSLSKKLPWNWGLVIDYSVTCFTIQRNKSTIQFTAQKVETPNSTTDVREGVSSKMLCLAQSWRKITVLHCLLQALPWRFNIISRLADPLLGGLLALIRSCKTEWGKTTTISSL